MRSVCVEHKDETASSPSRTQTKLYSMGNFARALNCSLHGAVRQNLTEQGRFTRRKLEKIFNLLRAMATLLFRRVKHSISSNKLTGNHILEYLFANFFPHSTQFAFVGWVSLCAAPGLFNNFNFVFLRVVSCISRFGSFRK